MKILKPINIESFYNIAFLVYSSMVRNIKSINIFYILIILNACTTSKNELEQHFTESLLVKGLELINTDSFERANAFVDSLKTTWPYQSIYDKYRYYYFKGKFYSNEKAKKKNFTKAQIYADSMAAIIEDNDLTIKMNREYAEAYNFKSLMYIDEGKIYDALEQALKARSIIEKSGDKCGMSKYSSNAGLIYFKMNNYEMALESFMKEFHLLKNCPNNNDLFYQIQLVLANIGRCNLRLNNFKEAHFYYNERINYILTNKDLIKNNIEFFNIAMSDANNAKARLFLKEKNFTKALQYAKEADIYNKSIQLSETNLYFKYSLYAEIFLGLKLNKEFLKYMPLCNKYSKALKNENLLNYFNLKQKEATLSNKMGDILKYTTKYYNLKDSIDTNNKPLKTKNLESEFQKKQDQLSLEILKKENQIKLLIAIGIGSLLILSLISLYYVYFSLRKNKQLVKEISLLNTNLLEKEKNLKQLFVENQKRIEKEKIEELQLQEVKFELDYKNGLLLQKKKISNDLHDGISSTLTALKYYLTDQKKNIEKLDKEKLIQEILSEVNSIIENFKNYLQNLQQKNESIDFDIFKYLKLLKSKIGQNGSMNIDLKFDEFEIKKKLNYNQLKQMSLIISELISNAIKHSKAKNLSININALKNTVVIVVTDDGQGFDLNTVNKGLGLLSIQQRTFGLGGQLQVNTMKPNGTICKVEFPIGNMV